MVLLGIMGSIALTLFLFKLFENAKARLFVAAVKPFKTFFSWFGADRIQKHGKRGALAIDARQSRTAG